MTHLIHSFNWRSRFSTVPGLFPCQTLWGESFPLSKELNFSLFSLLTFPDHTHTFLLDLLFTLLLPHSVGSHFPLLHSGSHVPDSCFGQVYLDSFYSLPILSPVLSFGWYFSDWTNYPFLLFRHRQAFHMFYIKLCACAWICVNIDEDTSQNLCFQAAAKAQQQISPSNIHSTVTPFKK